MEEGIEVLTFSYETCHYFQTIVYTEYILMVIVCGLTFPSMRITLAVLLERTSDFLYDSAKTKNFYSLLAKESEK